MSDNLSIREKPVSVEIDQIKDSKKKAVWAGRTWFVVSGISALSLIVFIAVILSVVTSTSCKLDPNVVMGVTTSLVFAVAISGLAMKFYEGKLAKYDNKLRTLQNVNLPDCESSLSVCESSL